MVAIHFSSSARGKLNDRVSICQAPTRSSSVGSRTSIAGDMGGHHCRSSQIERPHRSLDLTRTLVTLAVVTKDRPLLLEAYMERERDRIVDTLFEWLRI